MMRPQAESNLHAKMNALIATCQDAERGLLRAAELAIDPALKNLFIDTAYRRARLAARLKLHTNRLDGATTTPGTTGATLHRVWMTVRSVLSGRDDRTVVAEVWRGNRLTHLAFKHAADGVWSATVRDLVEEGYLDLRESRLAFAELNHVALSSQSH